MLSSLISLKQFGHKGIVRIGAEITPSTWNYRMTSTCVVPVWCPGGGRIGHWGKHWSRRSGRSGSVLDSPLCQLAQFPSSSAGGGTCDWCCWTIHDHSTCTDRSQSRLESQCKCSCIAFFKYYYNCMFNYKCTTIRVKSLTESPLCFSDSSSEAHVNQIWWSYCPA